MHSFHACLFCTPRVHHTVPYGLIPTKLTVHIKLKCIDRAYPCMVPSYGTAQRYIWHNTAAHSAQLHRMASLRPTAPHGTPQQNTTADTSGTKAQWWHHGTQQRHSATVPPLCDGGNMAHWWQKAYDGTTHDGRTAPFPAPPPSPHLCHPTAVTRPPRPASVTPLPSPRLCCPASVALPRPPPSPRCASVTPLPSPPSPRFRRLASSPARLRPSPAPLPRSVACPAASAACPAAPVAGATEAAMQHAGDTV